MAEIRNRYAFGEVLIRHRDELVNTSVGSPEYDRLSQNIESEYQYDIGYIPVGYEHRPDLISSLFYGTPAHYWLLMLVNGVSDAFEGFNAGDRIKIPKL